MAVRSMVLPPIQSSHWIVFHEDMATYNRMLLPQNTESKNLALSRDDTGTILLLSLVSVFSPFFYFFIACLWYSVVYTGLHKCGCTCMCTCLHMSVEV